MTTHPILWKCLLGIKEILKVNHDCTYLSVDTTGSVEVDRIAGNEIFRIVFSGQFQCENLVNCNEPFRTSWSSVTLNADELKFLQLYLDYALLPHWSAQMNRCFTISHFAQTLDGRIASSSGESKWIGNDANLVHAHRMRALCDGVLVGANTLNVDNPKLNVRHVEGSDPTKIVVGGEDLTLQDYQSMVDGTILFCQNHYESSATIKKMRIPMTAGNYEPKRILEALREENIGSVYIEGGSITASTFLEKGQIDQLQVHVSPKILGSGTTGFSFGGIDSITEAIEFNHFRFYQMDDQVMFVGSPR